MAVARQTMLKSVVRIEFCEQTTAVIVMGDGRLVCGYRRQRETRMILMEIVYDKDRMGTWQQILPRTRIRTQRVERSHDGAMESTECSTRQNCFPASSSASTIRLNLSLKPCQTSAASLHLLPCGLLRLSYWCVACRDGRLRF